MAHVVSKLSLTANVVLLGVLSAYLAVGWKARALADQQEDPGVGLEHANRTYEAFILDRLAANKVIGLALPRITMSSLSGRTITTDLSKRKAAVVLLFEPKVCQACLITQLKALQLLHESVVDTAQIAVMAFSSSPPALLKRFTRAFGLTYPVLSDTTGQVVKLPLSETTPVVLLLNRDNTIIDSHIPSPGRPEFSLLFYNEIGISARTGAALDGKRYDFGLGGQPKLDVINNRFDATHPNAIALLR